MFTAYNVGALLPGYGECLWEKMPSNADTGRSDDLRCGVVRSYSSALNQLMRVLGDPDDDDSGTNGWREVEWELEWWGGGFAPCTVDVRLETGGNSTSVWYLPDFFRNVETVLTIDPSGWCLRR